MTGEDDPRSPDAPASEAPSPDASTPEALSSIDSDDPPSGITTRPADGDEYVDVMRILEGALLDVDAGEVRERIDAEDVLVAVETADSAVDGSDAAPVIAAMVIVPRNAGVHIEAIAVNRSRRGRGIGSALVRAGIRHAAGRGFDRIVAGFDPDLREFYAGIGFSIGANDRSPDDSRSDDRLLGELALESASNDRSSSR